MGEPGNNDLLASWVDPHRTAPHGSTRRRAAAPCHPSCGAVIAPAAPRSLPRWRDSRGYKPPRRPPGSSEKRHVTCYK